MEFFKFQFNTDIKTGQIGANDWKMIIGRSHKEWLIAVNFYLKSLQTSHFKTWTWTLGTGHYSQKSLMLHENPLPRTMYLSHKSKSVTCYNWAGLSWVMSQSKCYRHILLSAACWCKWYRCSSYFPLVLVLITEMYSQKLTDDGTYVDTLKNTA